MAKRKTRSGYVDYKPRAFHQDASEAMRSDIVRGLIELITNSDDAYAAMEDIKVGKISVEVEHKRNQPWRVVVRDRACGMSGDTMVQRLAAIGGRTSGFESGENRRGNLGRGAKDLTAFGPVTFESIRDNKYARFVLKEDGSWTLDEGEADEEARERTGIRRGSGTVVTVEVAPGIRCPLHANLHRRLAGHFQLRDIFSDPTRKAELTNLNDDSRESLIYVYPKATVVFDKAIEIPGYKGVTASLKIWHLAERCDDGVEDATRPTGILIKGRRAIYDNTLFKYEGDVHAGWFGGKVECEHIDWLARDFDNRLASGKPIDQLNPVPIISRSRDGLASDHPFVEALKTAVEVPLGRLVAEQAERARSEAKTAESDETRNALNRLARELGRLVTEELREIEAEDLVGDGGDGQAPLLSIIPEEAILYMGEARTLTVVARKTGLNEGDEIKIEADPGGVVEVVTSTAVLKAHARREDVLVAQVQLRPLVLGEATMITASIGSRIASALIEVRPPREIVEEVVQPPPTLQFDRPAYRIGWQRKRVLTLNAPVDVVASIGENVQISCSNAGIVIRTPQVRLVYDDELDFFTAKVVVEGRTLDAAGELLARMGSLVAATQLKVTRKEEEPEFRIELSPEEMGSYRATIEVIDERQVVKVAARHPAIFPFLGAAYEGQNTPIVRALVSEAVADAAARLVVSKLYRQRRNTEVFDVDRYYREHYKRVLRFLPRFQKVLVGDHVAARADVALSPNPLLPIEAGAPFAPLGRERGMNNDSAA